MGWDQNVSQADLRASAGAVDTLVTDLRPILAKALADLADAGASFANGTDILNQEVLSEFRGRSSPSRSATPRTGAAGA